MAKLDQFELVLFDEFQGEPQQTPGGPKLLERVPVDPVGVGGVEVPAARLIRGDDDEVGRVERLDEPPVVRLGAADPAGENRS